MTIVSLELSDQPQFSLHIQSVMQTERSAQLTHTQMSLQPLRVVWKRKSLISLLAQRNSLAQTINEL